MRSIRQTLKEQSVLSKTQRNHSVLLRTRFTTLWRSETHINLKTDADVLTDAGVAFVSGSLYVICLEESEGSMMVSAHASTV